MNTIEFKINQHGKNIGSYEYYDVIVLVDRKEIPYDILNGVAPIAASQVDNIEFDLFTCDCGEPGCAGFMDPILQEKTKDTVIWRLDGKYERLFGSSQLTFNREQFETTFNELYKTIKNLEDNKVYLWNMLDTFIVEDEKQNAPYSIDEGMKYFNNVFHFESLTKQTIKEAAPEYYNKEFIECYNGICSNHAAQFEWIVNGALNQYCSKFEGSKFFMAKVTYAAKAIVEFIENRNAKDLERFIKFQYRKSGLDLSDFSVFTQGTGGFDWQLLKYEPFTRVQNLKP